MPLEFTKDQIDDLREIHVACLALNTDFVIIGATAYQLYFPDESRFTADIDMAIALDLDQFSEFARRLEDSGWMRDPNKEHRWRGGRGSYFDLLPAGIGLRQAKQIIWPKSEFVMNLVGFDHVFIEAEPHLIGQDLSVKAIPPIVLTLTKIVSFMDDPYRREKDLTDIQSLLACYEENSDRIFDEVVFDARLSDIGLANAFLLGFDLGKLCTPEEQDIVDRFIERFAHREDHFALQLGALKNGLRQRG